MSGPESAVQAVDIGEAGGKLTVVVPASGQAVTVVRSLTVVTGPGASSEVTIGGTPASAEGAPLDMVLEVPAGTALDLEGFVGDAVIGDLLADVRIGVVHGTVTLGAVHDAVLDAVGSGRIEAASVTGDAVANVTGDGRIAVEDGAIGDLTVTVTGAGVVTVDAPPSAPRSPWWEPAR